jgi:hypothetical protein
MSQKDELYVNKCGSGVWCDEPYIPLTRVNSIKKNTNIILEENNEELFDSENLVSDIEFIESEDDYNEMTEIINFIEYILKNNLILEKNEYVQDLSSNQFSVLMDNDSDDDLADDSENTITIDTFIDTFFMIEDNDSEDESSDEYEESDDEYDEESENECEESDDKYEESDDEYEEELEDEHDKESEHDTEDKLEVKPKKKYKLEYLNYCTNNLKSILKDENGARCVYCFGRPYVDENSQTVDNSTVLCNICGIDAVVPSSVVPNELTIAKWHVSRF